VAEPTAPTPALEQAAFDEKTEAFQAAAVNAIDSFLAEATLGVRVAFQEYASATEETRSGGEPVAFAGLELPKPDVQLQKLVSNRSAFEATFQERQQEAVERGRRIQHASLAEGVGYAAAYAGLATFMVGFAAAPIALGGLALFSIIGGAGVMRGNNFRRSHHAAIAAERETELSSRDPRFDFPISLSQMSTGAVAAAKSAGEEWQSKVLEFYKYYSRLQLGIDNASDCSV
jgi:hypothetical protein